MRLCIFNNNIPHKLLKPTSQDILLARQAIFACATSQSMACIESKLLWQGFYVGAEFAHAWLSSSFLHTSDQRILGPHQLLSWLGSFSTLLRNKHRTRISKAKKQTFNEDRYHNDSVASNSKTVVTYLEIQGFTSIRNKNVSVFVLLFLTWNSSRRLTY